MIDLLQQVVDLYNLIPVPGIGAYEREAEVLGVTAGVVIAWLSMRGSYSGGHTSVTKNTLKFIDNVQSGQLVILANGMPSPFDDIF